MPMGRDVLGRHPGMPEDGNRGRYCDYDDRHCKKFCHDVSAPARFRSGRLRLSQEHRTRILMRSTKLSRLITRAEPPKCICGYFDMSMQKILALSYFPSSHLNKHAAEKFISAAGVLVGLGLESEVDVFGLVAGDGDVGSLSAVGFVP